MGRRYNTQTLLNIEKLARRIMDEHGLQDWEIGMSSRQGAYGRCRYGDKSILITKSLNHDREIELVINTILHEIAHALVGPGHGHSNVWKYKAIEIGCIVNHEKHPWDVGSKEWCDYEEAKRAEMYELKVANQRYIASIKSQPKTTDYKERFDKSVETIDWSNFFKK